MNVSRVRNGFPKTARLRKRPEFLKLSSTGRKFYSAHFVIVSGKNNCAESRLGITVSGKVGNAVARNRIKRLIREFFRCRRHEFGAGWDFLVIARKGASKISSCAVAEEISKGLVELREQRKS